MNHPRPTWHAVLSLVPEARSVPAATSDAVTKHVSQLPAQRHQDTPARLLAEVLSVAAGPAHTDVREALTTDTARREGTATLLTGPNRPAGIVLLLVMAVALFVPMPGSSRYGGGGEPFLDVQPAVLVSGVLSVIALVAYVVLTSRAPIPHSRIWFPAFTIILGFDLVYSLSRIEDDSYDSSAPLLEQVRGPLIEEAVGVGLMLLAVVGFAVLSFLGRRRPSPLATVYGDSEESRALDEQLLTDVRRAIHERDDVHLDSLRAQAVGGVHELFDRERVDVMEAAGMLREVLDHYPVPRAQH